MNHFSTHGNGRVGRINHTPAEIDISLLIGAQTPHEAAEAALKIGLKPVPLHAIGATMKTKAGDKKAQGKEPMGFGWHTKTWSSRELKTTYSTVQNRGVGLLLGPNSGLIDIEIDQPKGVDSEEFRALADAELASLCGGEIPATAGWESGRGRHRLFMWDSRLQIILDAEISVIKHGRLEIRFGAGKGAQSAIPPTKHANATRQWFTDATKVARLPDAAINNLLAAAEKQIRERITKRLIGQARKLADNIREADKGDSDNGRHPTALISARTMAGFVQFYNRHDLTDQIKQILLIGYQDSKPELDAADGEFAGTIDAGWEHGLLEPLGLSDRPLNGDRAVNGTDQHNGHVATETAARSTPAAKAGEAIGLNSHAAAKVEPAKPSGLVFGKAATLATIRQRCSERVFLWPWFFARKSLNLLDGKPGVGKSRFLLESLRRIRQGEAWPDGAPQETPAESKFLWIAADGNYDQLVETADAFGIPDDAIVFPGSDIEPYEHTDLSDPVALAAIRQRLADDPAIVAVVVDTATSALGSVQQTDRTGIAAIAKGLGLVAREANAAILLIGHQNKAGGSYGDAWPAVVDCRLAMEMDGGQVRIEVTEKTRWNHRKAPVLRGTQGDAGWTFTVEPRELEAANAGAAVACATDQGKLAILEYVKRYSGQKKSDVIKRITELTGISRSTLYSGLGELTADGQVICYKNDFGKFEADCLDIGPPDSDSQTDGSDQHIEGERVPDGEGGFVPF